MLSYVFLREQPENGKKKRTYMFSLSASALTSLYATATTQTAPIVTPGETPMHERNLRPYVKTRGGGNRLIWPVTIFLKQEGSVFMASTHFSSQFA